MSVTIYEIAERAGVSSSTVARILRGDVRESHRRSAATAKRIRQIANELGYRPNLRARAFSRGRTHGIGLLYTDDAWIFEGVNTAVVNSLVRSLQREGYHLVFTPVDESGSWEGIVLGGQIDGGVVFQTLPAEVADAVRERQLPLVLLGDDTDPGMSQVVVDDFAGAYAATKHLIGLGHQRVMLFVHESVKPHCSVEERLSGYRTAMDEAGLMPCEGLRLSEGEAVDNLVRGKSRPTGVVCYSDLESTLLVHALWQYGLAIPGDVSLVGFNDVFGTRYMTPPLTTVGFDAAKIGEHGARLVLELVGAVEADRKPTVVTVKPTLIVRGSTGPVAAVGNRSRTDDGSPANGSPANGSPANGASENGASENGHAAHGRPVGRKPGSRKSIRGSIATAESDGLASDGLASGGAKRRGAQDCNGLQSTSGNE